VGADGATSDAGRESAADAEADEEADEAAEGEAEEAAEAEAAEEVEAVEDPHRPAREGVPARDTPTFWGVVDGGGRPRDVIRHLDRREPCRSIQVAIRPPRHAHTRESRIKSKSSTTWL
jgi:hypothetical protein